MLTQNKNASSQERKNSVGLINAPAKQTASATTPTPSDNRCIRARLVILLPPAWCLSVAGSLVEGRTAAIHLRRFAQAAFPARWRFVGPAGRPRSGHCG